MKRDGKNTTTFQKTNGNKSKKIKLKIEEIPFLEELYTMRVEMGKDREGIDRKSSLMADKYREFLENNITDKELLRVLLKKFNAIEDRVDKEINLISVIDYSLGMEDSKILNKEMSVVKKLKAIIPVEQIFEKIYNIALEEVSQRTEEDKKFFEEKLKKIDFSDILETLDEEKKKEFNTMIDEKFNNIYIELGYLCQKYWKNGFNYGAGAILICF